MYICVCLCVFVCVCACFCMYVCESAHALFALLCHSVHAHSGMHVYVLELMSGLVFFLFVCLLLLGFFGGLACKTVHGGGIIGTHYCYPQA